MAGLSNAERAIIEKAEQELRERGDDPARAEAAWHTYVREAAKHDITLAELIRYTKVESFAVGTDVNYVYHDGCETTRGEGHNNQGDLLKTEIDTPSNQRNPSRYKTEHYERDSCSDGGGGAPSPNPGPDGGPTPGDPCGGCGGGPNASVDFKGILDGKFPALSPAERLVLASSTSETDLGLVTTGNAVPSKQCGVA